MCYRITQARVRRAIEDGYEASFRFPEVYRPYYDFNIWEKDKYLYIIKQDDPETIDVASWGLLPTAYDLSQRDSFLRKNLTYNATSERLFESNLFSQFIYWQRCLILVEGFIEPHKDVDIKGSIPFHFRMKDRSLFAFAGIYSVIDDDIETPIYTASIITMEANDLFRKIHNSPNKNNSYRQPLILQKNAEWEWLSCNNNEDSIRTLLHSFTTKEIETFPVSQDIYKTKVNSDRQDILQPISYPNLKVEY